MGLERKTKGLVNNQPQDFEVGDYCEGESNRFISETSGAVPEFSEVGFFIGRHKSGWVGAYHRLREFDK